MDTVRSGRNILYMFVGSQGFDWWFSFATVFQSVVVMVTQGPPSVPLRSLFFFLFFCFF